MVLLYLLARIKKHKVRLYQWMVIVTIYQLSVCWISVSVLWFYASHCKSERNCHCQTILDCNDHKYFAAFVSWEVSHLTFLSFSFWFLVFTGSLGWCSSLSILGSCCWLLWKRLKHVTVWDFNMSYKVIWRGSTIVAEVTVDGIHNIFRGCFRFSNVFWGFFLFACRSEFVSSGAFDLNMSAGMFVMWATSSQQATNHSSVLGLSIYTIK